MDSPRFYHDNNIKPFSFLTLFRIETNRGRTRMRAFHFIGTGRNCAIRASCLIGRLHTKRIFGETVYTYLSESDMSVLFWTEFSIGAKFFNESENV